jgi:hypothetical protein
MHQFLIVFTQAFSEIIIAFISLLQSQMPDPKTYKQHFENKHPKNDLPEDLKDV